jgi:hypothetical protein
VADGREVYAWPEMTLYAYSGTASGAFAYAENVDLTVTRVLQKKLVFGSASYADRARFYETDRNIMLSIGAMYAGVSFFNLVNSAAQISATLNFAGSADNASSTFTLYSAQFSDFNLQGADGGTWHQKLKIVASDISGI